MICLEQKQFQEIIEHCQEEYPKEACGILAGRLGQQIKDTGRAEECESAGTQEQEGEASKVLKMVNTSESPEVCYFMDPTEQLKVFKEMRHSGIEMIGIYHSHAGSPAYPSQRDCEMAFYPEAAYVIVSLQDFDSPVVRAFKIAEGQIEEVGIRVIGDE